MTDTDHDAPPVVRGKLVTRAEMPAIAGIAKTMLDDWVRRGCPVHRPSGRKGAPAGFDTAAVLEWRLAQASRF